MMATIPREPTPTHAHIGSGPSFWVTKFSATSYSVVSSTGIGAGGLGYNAGSRHGIVVAQQVTDVWHSSLCIGSSTDLGIWVHSITTTCTSAGLGTEVPDCSQSQ